MSESEGMRGGTSIGRGTWFKTPKQYVWLLRLLEWGDQTERCYLCQQPSVARYTPYGLPDQMALTLEDDDTLSAFLAGDERYRAEVTREQVWEHLGWLGPYPVCLQCAREVIRACAQSWVDVGVPLFGDLAVTPGETPGGYSALLVCADRGHWDDPRTDRTQHAGIFVLNRPGVVDGVLLVRQVSDWTFSHDLT